MLDEFFTLGDNLVEKSQLVAIREIEVAVDADRVSHTVSLRETPFDLTG